MKKQIRKWLLRTVVSVLFVAGLLIMIILNPVLTYGNKTVYHRYTIYHQQPLNLAWMAALDRATRLVERSEYYDPLLKLDICLNDGSAYPALVQKLFGQAFGWGFYNKVVLGGEAKPAENRNELNGSSWNLTQLLAHEMMHCYQVHKRGVLKSNPVAGFAVWKWEGYPEYVARQAADQTSLVRNIDRLLQTEKIPDNNWIFFADSTGTVIPYYKHWLFVQYCFNIKKMRCDQVLSDTTGEQTLQQEMMGWYGRQKTIRK